MNNYFSALRIPTVKLSVCIYFAVSDQKKKDNKLLIIDND
jgi:hypothetical protein